MLDNYIRVFENYDNRHFRKLNAPIVLLKSGRTGLYYHYYLIGYRIPLCY